MSRASLVTLVALGLVLAGVLPAVAAQPRGSAHATGPPDSLSFAQQDFDRTEFVIEVYANGSARWTFQYKKALNDSNRQAFEDYAERFNSENTTLYRDFLNRSKGLVDTGERRLDRNMSASTYHKTARVSDLGNQGIVEMSFTWHGFAVSEDDRVVVGDVFQDGLYVAGSQELTVRPGPDLRFVDASPEPDFPADGDVTDASAITWEGEREFHNERPRVRFGLSSSGTAADGGAGTESAPPGTSSTTSTGGVPPGGPGVLPLVALLLVVLLGLAGAFVYRSGGLPLGGGDGDDGGAGAGAGAMGGAVDAEPAVPDEELLSDEDRVLGLLEDNGGRMKQVNIVEETGWSKSKVSMLLSDMEDEDQISKLRVGRENIISLKGEEPDAARSPFEDDE